MKMVRAKITRELKPRGLRRLEIFVRKLQGEWVEIFMGKLQGEWVKILNSSECSSRR